MKFPLYLKKYFWDTKFAELDPKQNRAYILSRIFEYGDQKAIQWAFHQFPKEEIRKTLQETNSLSPKSGNFWALFFGLDKTNLRCFQKSSLQLRSSHWIS